MARPDPSRLAGGESERKDGTAARTACGQSSSGGRSARSSFGDGGSVLGDAMVGDRPSDRISTPVSPTE